MTKLKKKLPACPRSKDNSKMETTFTLEIRNFISFASSQCAVWRENSGFTSMSP